MPIPIDAPLVPRNEAGTPAVDKQEVVDDAYVKGGFHVCADTTERNAIPPKRRKQGMEVHTLSPDKFWKLSAPSPWAMDDTDWTEIAVVPDASLQPDGDVLTVVSGAPVWSPPTAPKVPASPLFSVEEGSPFMDVSAGNVSVEIAHSPTSPGGSVDGDCWLIRLDFYYVNAANSATRQGIRILSWRRSAGSFSADGSTVGSFLDSGAQALTVNASNANGYPSFVWLPISTGDKFHYTLSHLYVRVGS